jgi:hypothetical protein
VLIYGNHGGKVFNKYSKFLTDPSGRFQRSYEKKEEEEKKEEKKEEEKVELKN